MIVTTYNVPALLATEAAPTVSDRYNHISTRDIHEIMGSLGWDARIGHTVNSRTGSDPLYRKHMLRYTQTTGEIDKEFPEIIITNSHDGSCALIAKAGIFRLVCSNGMTIQTENYGSLRIAHTDDIAGSPLDMIDLMYDYATNVQQVLDIPRLWRNINVRFPDRMDFYRDAAALRSKHMTESELVAFDSPQREEDASNDLWTVFNRTQEYLVRGGYRATSSNERQRKVRAINSVDSLDRVNSDLFQLANEVAITN